MTKETFERAKKLRSEIASLEKEIEQEPIDKFPYIDFRRNIAEELSRDDLINRLCEMNVKYRKMREVYLEWESREKEPDKTAEEILHEHTKDSQWYAPVCDKRIIEAMNDYARQSQINLRDELSPRIAKLIIQIRDLIVEKAADDLIDEIWHSLYQIANPNYDKLCDDVWSDLERIASKLKDNGISDV